jgi:ribosomal protein L11 methylase PrmA
LKEIAGRLSAGVPAPQTLIASGFLTSEADGVHEAFARAGFREERAITRGEWSAVRWELLLTP